MEIYISRRSLDYTNGSGFVHMKMNKRCTMEIYISLCTYEVDEKMHSWYQRAMDLKVDEKMHIGNLHFPKMFGLYQRTGNLHV